MLLVIPYSINRFFSLSSQLSDYMNFEGSFKNPTGKLKNPDVIWKAFDKAVPELTRLAQTLLGIVPHAAAVERLWSFTGNMDTASRNRLKPETMLKLSIIRAAMRIRALEKETARVTQGAGKAGPLAIRRQVKYCRLQPTTDVS